VNIAIVKLSSLGDVVHALPVAATLRARWPTARLTWIVERREARVLAGHPALDDIVIVDTRGWRRARSLAALAGVMSELRVLVGRLRRDRPDVVLDLQGLLKSGVLAALSRAPLRIGFTAWTCREPLSALGTNRRVPRSPGRHVVEEYLGLLAALGIREPVMEFRLPSDPAAETRIDEFYAAVGFKPRDRVVVVNPGAGRASKRWPAERFRAVARRLAAEAGAQVLVTWGPGEEAVARAIAEPDGAPRVVLAPPTDLHELIATLRRASLVLAGDTGPLHLAAALGTPCVAVYGPTSARRNGPWGAGHRALEGGDGRVETVGVAEVFAAAVEVLG
jgi:lipopolysaccharide heptosyltransferase I